MIGIVKGPGESPQEFTFITSDNSRTKVGEFITYQANDRLILAKISQKRLARSLPDSFFANPQIRPSDVASMIGADIETLYEVTATISGYFDSQLGCFVNPRIPPSPGDRIQIAPDQMLSDVFGNRKVGDIGSAHIGSLLLRDSDAVPVVLDIKAIASTHLAILAGTGSGKSYTAGVLLEEMLKPYNRASILVLDPHGEYGTFKGIESHPDFGADGYIPEVKTFRRDTLKVRFSSLALSDLRALLPNLTDKMEAMLRQAYRAAENKARNKYGDAKGWALDDLLMAIDAMRGDDESSDINASTIHGLLWRLERLRQSPVFHNSEHTPLTELFCPGRLTVLDLSEVDQREQQVIAAVLLRKAYEARVDHIKGNTGETLSYPVFVLIEEAHRFAPANAEAVSCAILKTILSEGRKFGVGIGLVTQRPGKLDADVLSQCMTQFIMRIVNPIDQNSIAAGVESAGRDLLSELPALTKGQAIIAGVALNTPVLCRIRPRLTRHGGETLDAPLEWQRYFEPKRVEVRAQQEAFLAAPQVPKPSRGLSI